MNEVSNNRVAESTMVTVTSSKRPDVGGTQAGTSQAKIPASTKPVPREEPAQPVSVKNQSVQNKIEAAVAQINEFIQNEQRDLSFSVDEASGMTVFNTESPYSRRSFCSYA